MSERFDQMSFAQLMQLRDEVSRTIKKRFEHSLALVFTDVVGSTPYFARHGDQAGRALQQRHLDMLRTVVEKNGGRIVDTAGDGAFTCFPQADAAALALLALCEAIAHDNDTHPREHRLHIRAGMHFGLVLTDGTLVAGDAVNLCSRVAGSGAPGEIRLTRATFQELSGRLRLRCHPIAKVDLKGIAEPVDVLILDWIDRSVFPAAVRVGETGAVIPLPPLDTIAFGRLREKDGMAANDVVLDLPDKELLQAISRWHFELRRRSTGFVVRAVSGRTTELNGKALTQGEDVPLRTGDVLKLSGVMTLMFIPDPSGLSSATADTGATIEPAHGD